MIEGDDGFQKFWAAYPVKRAKADALKAWTKLKPSAELVEQMIEAIAIQARSRQWRDGFTPYPATWLRRGQWADELGAGDFYQARL